MVGIDKDKLNTFKVSEGLFAIVDYITPNGIETAMGKLESVSPSGDIIIRHLDNPKVSWGFNIDSVKSHKFSPIKKKGGSNGN